MRGLCQAGGGKPAPRHLWEWGRHRRKGKGRIRHTDTSVTKPGGGWHRRWVDGSKSRGQQGWLLGPGNAVGTTFCLFGEEGTKTKSSNS